mmetsp:Transcript_23773/g.49007  ORF Transcript_23773/g.49007 Transcript_23773/m.49007 type:complete len:469 (+) Transcript_23773:114-1520(+)
MVTKLQKGVAIAVLTSVASIAYYILSYQNLLPDELEVRRQQKIALRRQQSAIASAKKRERRETLRKLDRKNHLPKFIDRALNLRQQQLSPDEQRLQLTHDVSAPQTICGRPTAIGTLQDFNLLRQSQKPTCPGTNPQTSNNVNSDENNPPKSLLLLDGGKARGRTGNNLVEFLHALQYSRDHDIRLGVMTGSWAMRVLLKMWMAIDLENEEEWVARFEEAFCLKIFRNEEELVAAGYTRDKISRMDTKELFWYVSSEPLEEYMSSQAEDLRVLWRGYNTGMGVDSSGEVVNDMCSGINAVFGNGEDKSEVVYSVIHSRSLEGEPGYRLLSNVSKHSGCDPVAALEMRPEYIKSILKPLGMLQHPIVFITDGQSFEVLQRLLTDPDIGPLIRLVPEEASWIGGDMTLGLMSNVFIGNPASTFSGFIAKSRVAMGFGHNYLFMSKDGKGGYRPSCGDVCIFNSKVMGVMS